MVYDLEKELSKLTVKKLADLLSEHSQSDTELHEKCELLLASKEINNMAKLIREKIRSIVSGKKFYDWRHAHAFSSVLNHLRTSIVNEILPKNPKLAADLLEEIILNDSAIIDSVDDSSGYMGQVFYDIVEDWGHAWEKIVPRDEIALADKVFTTFMGNNYGVRDNIIKKFSNALGDKGINHIEQKLNNLFNSKNDDSYRYLTIRIGLQEIAEIRQDMTMYIKYATDSGKVFNSMILDKIIEHFIEYDRPSEALDWLNKYKDSKDKAFSHDRLMLKVNQCLGNIEAIKENHWTLFCKSLSIDNFTSLIDLLDQKEKVNYRKKAIKIALNYSDVLDAINFLQLINEFDQATHLLHHQYHSINGDWYSQLQAIANHFEEKKYYLETVLIYRRLAESILKRAKSTIYHYAVSYLKKAKKLESEIVNWDKYPKSSEYIPQLREIHGRKYAFWSKFED